MRILILGGSVFLGAATLDAALGAGHTVSVFNRGRSRTDWPSGVETLTGDRAGDLAPLRGRRWDAVIDISGYVPAEVQASAEVLVGHTSRYLHVSSISAYASAHQAPMTENDPLASSEGMARDDRAPRFYGAQKAACEQEVVRVFGDRATIVRPGLIVGPGDPTGRFSHWPWRSAAGGEMVVPDMPEESPLQFIDVRDLGPWLLRLLEDDRAGVFNATGPVRKPAAAAANPAVTVGATPLLCWSTLIATCAAEVLRRGGTPATPVRVAEAFLLDRGIKPWLGLPLWLPSADAAMFGFFQVATDRAVAAGLVTRDLRDTVGAVLDEGTPDESDPRRSGRLDREAERALLAAWAQR